MASAFRLIAVVALALLSVLVGGARAQSTTGLPPGDVPPSMKTQYGVAWPGQADKVWFGSGDEACNAAGPHYWDPKSNWFGFDPTTSMCTVDDKWTFTGVSQRTGPVCDDPIGGGSTLDPNANPPACACNSGKTDSQGSYCVQKQDSDCPAAGTDIGGADNVLPRMPGGGTCVAGCVIRGSGSVTGANGESVSYGPYTSTGKACDASTNSSPVGGGTSTASCVKGGGLPGTVNGVAVCTPGVSTTTSSTSSSASTSASGVASGSTTTTDTTDNHDGTTTTTTTTTNSDGSTTVTRTTAPTPSAAASGSGGGSSPDQTSDTCKLHPDLAMCKVSKFGGTCAAAFTCDGDAVQCAIALEQHQRDCAFYDPASSSDSRVSDAASRYNQAVSDGDKPSWSPTSSSGGSSDAILDMSSSIKADKHWGAECVPDQVLALSAYSVTIPWSGLCGQMTMIGNVVLAVTALVCVGIVFKN